MRKTEGMRLQAIADDARREANVRGNLGLELLRQASEWEAYAVHMNALATAALEIGVAQPSRTSREIDRASKLAFDSGEVFDY